jgi:ribosomal protein S18 acetylase RimI-like enzyme
MKVEFLKADAKDLQSLIAFDHAVFPKSDWFDTDCWKLYESWWMIVDGVRAGCCAFERHADFQEYLRRDGKNLHLLGSLYIASTGILPRLQGRGLGALLKTWQIAYARRHGFTRIVANTRKSNLRMIRLNRRFGFKVIRTTRGYYHDPVEATVVMELDIARASRLD